jgi:hypothetical protein
MVDPQRPAGTLGRKATKKPTASPFTERPRVDGPGADQFGIQQRPTCIPPTEEMPTEPEDLRDGLIDLIAKPGWELERAEALLRTGATMLQIEQHLVAKGLSPEGARAAAEWALEDRVREPFNCLAKAKRSREVDLILFAVAACLVAGLAGWFFGAGAASRMATAMLVLLGAIWIGQSGALLGRADTLQIWIVRIHWTGWIMFLYVVLRILATAQSLTCP